MRKSGLRIVTGAAVVAVLMTVIAVPASAAVTPLTTPRVSIATPGDNDYYRRGTLTIFGVACDPDAQLSDATAGISRVQAFAGSRDEGGQAFFRPGGYLGAATSTRPSWDSAAAQGSRLGLQNTDLSTCRQSNAGFRVITSALRKGTYDIYVYVMGANGKETVDVINDVRIDMP